MYIFYLSIINKMVEREKILRGVMTLLVLEKLCHEDMHGYALQVYVSGMIDRKIAPGTIYVLLGSLLRRKFIRISSQFRAKNRDVKVYTITDLGRDFLKDHISPLIIVRDVLDYLIPSITQIAEARDQQ